MQAPQRAARRVMRFGVFEVDLHARELRKRGIKIGLQQQPLRVLALLLEHAGEVVTREDLRQAIWPAGTFVEFDVGLDAAIHRLRAALDDSAESPRFVETLPRRGYRFIAAVDGVAQPLEESPPKRKVLSIAVLPLTNLGTDASDAALADGMTEELIGILARLGQVRVIASTSVFGFKGRPIDVRRIADSLRVSHILEGGFQRVGSRLRLQVRLVDARDGSTRWSATYDREMKDVFATQDELAGAVARELEVRLEGRTGSNLLRHRTRNIEAYELYLRGHDLTLHFTDSGLRAGLEYFNQAIALDSTFAAAYAAAARGYALLGWSGNPGFSLGELRTRAEAAVRKALALDDSLAEAHAALGVILMVWRGDPTSAEAEARRALALNPAEPRVHEQLAHIALLTGRPTDVLAEARLGLEADPLSPTAITMVARALYRNGRCDEALAQLQPVAGLRPPVRWAVLTAGLCFAEQRRWPEAIAALRQGGETGGVHGRTMLGFVLAQSGQRQEARQILAELLARQQRSGNLASDVAIVHAGLGDVDGAFTWLNRAADEGPALATTPLLEEIMGPAFRDLRRDPRFERVRKRLGLSR